MYPGKGIDNSSPGTATVKQRQEVRIHLPMQERVERFRNKEHLSGADSTILQVWRKYRPFYLTGV